MKSKAVNKYLRAEMETLINSLATTFWNLQSSGLIPAISLADKKAENESTSPIEVTIKTVVFV